MGWASTMRAFFTAHPSHVAGKVLHVGDSMTLSQAYGYWCVSGFGVGHTAEDTAIINWAHWDPANWNSDDNGFALAGGQALTAQDNAGWGSDWVLTSDSRPGPPLPGGVLGNSRTNNAQMAILMFNTPGAQRDLTAVNTVVQAYLGAGIYPILSTIPPRMIGGGFTDESYNYSTTYPYNGELRRYCRANNLPLIDFCAEMLLRRPGRTWYATLIDGGDGVHPSGGVSGYDPGSHPYTTGGDASIHKTGAALENSGYLLRTWLAVQKLKVIKQYAID